MNPFLLLTFAVQCISMSTSLLDQKRLEADLKLRRRLREYRTSLDVKSSLRELERATWFKRNFSLLRRPKKVLEAVKRFHQVGGKFLLIALLHLLILVYVLVKCLFHLMFTGDDFERAKLYERHYYFPRFFSSHETPHIFYKHSLALMSFSSTIRLIAICRLLGFSLANRDYYKKISISHVNMTLHSRFNATLGDLIEFVKWSMRLVQSRRTDYRAFRAHLSIDSKSINGTSSISMEEALFAANLVDFKRCYLEFEEGDGQRRRELWRSINLANKQRQYRMDPLFLGYLLILCFSAFVVAVLGVSVVVFCGVYFELAGAVREREEREFSFMETLGYYPKYFEEPWRLVRFVDMMIFSFIQVFCQLDNLVYCNDIIILMSRAHKVLSCLEQERAFCSLGSGEYYSQLFARYNDHFSRLPGGLDQSKRLEKMFTSAPFHLAPASNLNGCDRDDICVLRTRLPANQFAISQLEQQLDEQEHWEEWTKELEAGNELDTDELCARYHLWAKGNSHKTFDCLSSIERRRLNKRLADLVRMSQVLKSEFVDLKHYHSLNLNAVIIYSGFCIAYCVSLSINATSFSTFFPLTVNAISIIVPLVIMIFLSTILDRVFKDIHENFNMLLVNERSYLNFSTIRCLMIESYSFEASKDRSIQIVGQFSVTPESLSPLIVYIMTCILFLRRA